MPAYKISMAATGKLMLDSAHYRALAIEDIFEKTMAGERLSPEDGMRLFHCPDINAIGALANHVRQKMHGRETTYVVNRQINYSNICVNRCLFCAFRRDSALQPGAYVLSKEEMLERARQANEEARLDEIHIVGGCHPDLPFSWFEDILTALRDQYPDLPIKAFTPVEILHFARLEQAHPIEILKRLRAAGVCMMPGGGAEIFDADLRKLLCPEKADAGEWLEISGLAHSIGLKTNCTMLFGHLETYEQRIDHLCRLRGQQDKSGGFVCFIPLPYLKKNNRLALPPEKSGPGGGLDRLKTIAVSRLMLDNIPNIKAYWVMLGVKLAQAALEYGANDLDGTIVEEKIGHMAGASSVQALSVPELEAMIKSAGFEPQRRNAVFEKAG